ncbi:MAG: COQ9 family protein [Pseudomonadota bacterium]
MTTRTEPFDYERRAILDKALELSPFEGWNNLMIANAAEAAKVDAGTLAAAFRDGVRDVLRYWSARIDEDMLSKLNGDAFDQMKIREKVSFAVQTRIDAQREHKESARRAAAFLALPTTGLLGGVLAWRTADTIWRGLGDKSTDFNFYTKRGVLAGVWTSTFARWLADDDPDEHATSSFLANRIENVMDFEKAKAKIREFGIDPVKPVSWLAKLRYPDAARSD